MTGPAINSVEPDEDAIIIRKMLDCAQDLEDGAVERLQRLLATKFGHDTKRVLAWYELKVGPYECMAPGKGTLCDGRSAISPNGSRLNMTPNTTHSSTMRPPFPKN